MKRLATSFLTALAVAVLPQLLLADGPDRPDRDRPERKKAERPDHHRGPHEGRPEAGGQHRGQPQGHHGHFRGPHGPGPAGPMAGGPPRMPDPARVFEMFDKNDDGQLSKEEFVEGTKRVHGAMMRRHGGPPSPGPGGPSAHGRPGRPGGPPMGGPGGPFAQRGPGRPGGPPMGGPGGPGRQGWRPNPEMMKKHFENIDKNKDGKLSKEEAPERMKAHFDKIDANTDGQLEPAELKAAFEKMVARMKNQGPGRGPGAPSAHRPDGPPAAGPGGHAERFKAADKNNDGKLNKDEAGGPLKEHFEKIDTDKDGGLTPQEIRKAFEELHKRRAEA